MKVEKKVRFFSNKGFVKGKLSDFHDGYLFIDDFSLSTTLDEGNVKENRFKKKQNSKKTTPRIIDSDTKEPISFVNVIIEGSHVGTISNEDGYLETNIESKYQDNMILISLFGIKIFFLISLFFKYLLSLASSMTSFNKLSSFVSILVVIIPLFFPLI